MSLQILILIRSYKQQDDDRQLQQYVINYLPFQISCRLRNSGHPGLPLKIGLLQLSDARCFDGKAKSTSDCQSVRFGYSSAGRVVRLNLLRPDSTMARSSSKVTVISNSSDNVRQISKNFFSWNGECTICC